MQILIVDEEFNFAENVASILRIEGYQTIVLTDATEALRYFSGRSFSDRDYIILVDVSLAPGDNEIIFSADNTNEYMETGLVLVKKLEEMNVLPLRTDSVILYTAHRTQELWENIEAACEIGNYSNWQKRPTADPSEIIELVGRFNR